MPLRLSVKPVEQTITLESDPSGETFVVVRQATTGDVVKIGNAFGDQTQIFDDEMGNTLKIQKKWNLAELQRMRAYLTIIGCNIEDEDGSPWFKFRETRDGFAPGPQDAFFKAWDKLPPEISDDLYQAVIMVNPQWNPLLEDEEGE